jgi:O-antigen/teichoic acid export membrane protein
MKHSAIYFVARGLSGLINLLAITVYTRLTSPAVYGQFVIILAVVEFLNMFIFHWIRFGILRYSQRYSDNKKMIFLNSIIVLFFLMLIFTLLLSFFVSFLPIDFKWEEFWLLGLILLWIFAWYDLNLELLRAKLFPTTYAWIVFSKSILTLTCTLLMLLFDLGVLGLITGMMIGMLFPLLFVMKKNWKGIQLLMIDPNICKQLITYGFPLTITFSMHFLMVSSDRFMLGWFRGASESGLYSAAYDLTQQTLLLIMTIINLSAYPLVVQALEKRKNQVKKMLKQYTIALFFVSIPATTGYIILSPDISHLFLGPDFAEASIVIMPLIAITVFLQGIKQYYLDLSYQLGQRTWLQIWPNLIAVCVNVGCNFLWIPKWGILGAAYATLCANLVVIIISWLIGRKVFPLPFPFKEIIKILMATVMMVFVLHSIGTYSGLLRFCAQIVLGLFIYILVGFLLKVGGYHRYFINVFNRIMKKS